MTSTADHTEEALAQQLSAAPGDVPSLEVLSPITGDLVASYPIDDAASVAAAVARAREDSAWWADLGFDGRKEILGLWKGVIARRLSQLADVIHSETGKPHSDAVLEGALAIDHLHYATTKAEKVLSRRKVASGALMANQSAYLEYRPLGVVGVIGPWNYPLFTPMGSIAYALAAGNTVVFKPSELTPGVGLWLEAAMREVAPGRNILQVVVGYGETGNALCLAKVDKLAFTGSTATGKKVMAACATNLTPVLIEAGGKDALIVDEDADLDAAIDAATWGAFANAGQTCAGVERVYVHEAIYDKFMMGLVEAANATYSGADSGAKFGPMTLPGQVDIVRRHVSDALDRGGRAVVGGLDSISERFIQPIVLTGVPEDSVAVTEETFGPTMTVRKVGSMQEAIELTNNSEFGLGASVFSANRGPAIAAALRTGMTAVNSVLAFAAIPSLPFGGVGSSGFGRIHGEDGLREFTYAKAITVQRMKPVMALTSFSRTEKTDALVATLMSALHGGANQLGKAPKPKKR